MFHDLMVEQFHFRYLPENRLMQKVWDKYQSKGIVMLGVPSNDFGNQEPGTSKDIKNFCEAKFGITFPMTEKVVVKGENAHPFYKWARENH